MKTPNSREEDTQKFEELYRSQYSSLYRYAVALLKGYSSQDLYVSGRAEEAVQETFSLAWEKRREFFSGPSPVGWLYRTLHHKTQELIREDQTWTKRILRFSEAQDGVCNDFRLKAELSSIIPEEEYQLLKRLYLDGYTYRELAQELGIKQSTLAMRVKRIKARFITKFQDE